MEQAGDEAVLLSLFWCLTQERDTGSAECVCSTGALECRWGLGGCIGEYSTPATGVSRGTRWYYVGVLPCFLFYS